MTFSYACSMKVALVHELLTIRGGAERVLRILTEMFPDAPIYTLLYDEKKLGDWFPKHRVRAAKLPTPYSLLPTPYRYNHHLYLKTFPKTVESWDFSEFDLVISTSSAFVHGIITNGKPKHLCIVNSPARYCGDRTHDVMQQRGLSAPIINLALSSIFHRLRIWDAEAADRPDMLLAASKEVQRRVELYWRRKSDVLYPPLDDGWLMKPLSTSERSDYFLIVSTLVPYKRIDLAIAACNALGKQLKIVGEGPDLQRLRKMAGTTIEFLGYRSHQELCDLYASARAVLFPGEEDFGLVPLEAMACDTPVIAYGKGGALETIVDGKTGIFFREPTADSLGEALQQSESMAFDRNHMREHVQQFSRTRFEQELKKHIDALSQE